MSCAAVCWWVVGDAVLRSLDGEQGPYQNVFLQEMDVMNTLLAEIVRSLKELLLGTDHPPTAHHHQAPLLLLRRRLGRDGRWL